MKVHVQFSEKAMIEALDEHDRIVVAAADASCPVYLLVLLWVPIGFGLAYIRDHFGSNAAFVALACVVWFMAGSNLLASRTRKKLRAHIVKDFTSMDVEYNFLDDRIDVKSRDFSGSLDWRDIKDVRKTDKCLFLYLDNAHAYIIPVDHLECEAVYELAHRKSVRKQGD